jgi:hypothetical protein
MYTILHSSEHYSDKGPHAVLTRTRVLSLEQFFRIADPLRGNAEDLGSSSNPPTVENCRIAGALVGWACELGPMRISVKFDY